MEARCAGAIYGHLVGDAFGVPYEFLRPDALPRELPWTGGGAHGQPPGTWSDDGALMLCLVASLHERGKFDPRDAGERFIRWWERGYMAAGKLVFDIGGTTRAAIDALRSGKAPLDAGPAGEMDNGNGSLMRVLPVALYFRTAPLPEYLTMLHDCSRLTHGHACAQVCCAVYGLVLRGLLRGEDRAIVWADALDTAADAYGSSSAWGAPFVAEVERIRRFSTPTGGGFVVDCLCSAWQAVANATNYEDAVRRAVRFGNDTDTTAAVAGSMAGAASGISAIPSRWMSELRLTAESRALIDAFARSVAGGEVLRAARAMRCGETDIGRGQS